MERCGQCKRYLLVGERFRMFRTRFKRELAVCEPCQQHVQLKGWEPATRLSFQQLHEVPRVLNTPPLANSHDARTREHAIA